MLMQQRSEAEMMALILGYAEKEERVRAVWMNGSRANPDAPKDRWQDFDIVYAVTDMASFVEDSNWLDRFGERIIMQTSKEQLDRYDENGAFLYNDWYIAMMQFTDGNRIDLSLVPVQNAASKVMSDKMCKVLLDKDGILPPVPAATDADYRVKPPSALEFYCCVNEVRWVSPYVVKGLWRREIPYAQEMLSVVREQVMRMVGWQIVAERGETVNIGKCGKYLNRFLAPKDWQKFLSGYASANIGQMFDALVALYDLFAQSSGIVADAYNFPLDRTEEQNVREYLFREEKL